MSAVLGTPALLLLAGGLFAVATSFAAGLTWPALRGVLRGRHPARCARATLALAVAPTLLPVALVGLCLAPGVLGLLGLHADHCVRHPEHPHLCLAHPAALLDAPQAALALALGGAIAVAATRGALRLRRARLGVARLRLAAGDEVAPGVRRIESDRPFSVTAGLGRGEIFLSTALVRALPAAQLDVVLEHERAHARRRDGLRRLAARALSLPHRPAVRRELLVELELATERCCDEEAGRRVGDRLRVAETILAVERLLARAPGPAHPGLLAFGGSSVPERVRGLLAEPGAEGRPRTVSWVAAAAMLLGACLLAGPLHHGTEHLLGLLLAVQ